MRKAILITTLALFALGGSAGCKKKRPTGQAGGGSGEPGMKAEQAAMGAMGVATPEAMTPSTAGEAKLKAGTAPVAGLHRSAFVPADALAYGSIDTRPLLEAAKPILSMFAALRATKVKKMGDPKVRTVTPPTLTFETVNKMAVKQIGLDLTKLGRVTLIALVPPPSPRGRPAFFADPVLLASAAAFNASGKTTVEKIDSTPIYQLTQDARKGSVAIVGKTAIIGPHALVKKVLAVRLGKAARIGADSPLIKSIKSLQDKAPKSSSFIVLDFAMVRKELTARGKKLGAWESELDAGGIFFQPDGLTGIVVGQPKRVEQLTLMAKLALAVAKKELPKIQKELAQTAGKAAARHFADVRAALKTATIQRKDGLLTARLEASPVKVMTMAGMLTFLFIVRGSDSRPAGGQAASSASDTPPAVSKPTPAPAAVSRPVSKPAAPAVPVPIKKSRQKKTK